MPSKKLTQEDEQYLHRYNTRKTSYKEWVFFILTGIYVSAIPIFLFWRVVQLQVTQPLIGGLCIVATGIATYLLAFAYRNIKHQVKDHLLVSRERAVTAELAKHLEGLQKREREDRVNGRISRVATVEATAFSIGLNNLMFLSLMVLCAFFVFTRLEPVFNFGASMAVSTGLVALFSTASMPFKK